MGSTEADKALDAVVVTLAHLVLIRYDTPNIAQGARQAGSQPHCRGFTSPNSVEAAFGGADYPVTPLEELKEAKQKSVTFIQGAVMGLIVDPDDSDREDEDTRE